MEKITKQEALDYHTKGKPGKLDIQSSKQLASQRDLSLAYSPGVAEPVREIANNPDDVYKYTNKGNFVAVISNGSAILGLGNKGALASKPVMEGKAVLFKTFADIDAIDIELDVTDSDRIIETVKSIAPTFGGINLEDIKAPECFTIEKKLKEALDIPVFHDDQHGTAIIVTAGLLNALEIVGKDITKVKIAMNGAGSAGNAIFKMLENFGVTDEQIFICDSQGVIACNRDNLRDDKKKLCSITDKTTLSEVMIDADVFIGVTVADCVTPEMLNSMAENPIVFAMANPDPEIAYDLAMNTRSDLIMATGRSDHPNQVNNVLGFPYIFRGALDTRSTEINEEMKKAAALAIADLAKQHVPQEVLNAYNKETLEFGMEYIIPTPFDHRLISTVSCAVAKAAMESGVARIDLDLDAYKKELEERIERRFV